MQAIVSRFHIWVGRFKSTGAHPTWAFQSQCKLKTLECFGAQMRLFQKENGQLILGKLKMFLYAKAQCYINILF